MKFSVLSPVLRAACLGLALLSLAACAVQGTPSAQVNGKAPSRRAVPLSDSAKASLAYLSFLDHFHRMQRFLSGPMDQGAMDQLLDEQKLAAESLDQLMAVQPQPALYLEKAGLYLLNRQQLGQAKAIIKEGLERFPGDKSLRLSLVNLYNAEQRFDAAASVLEEYLQDNPDDQAASVFLARLLVDKNDPGKALAILEKIPADRQDLEVLQLTGRALALSGKTRQAHAVLERALALEPNSVETLAELAYVLEMDKDFKGAEKAYERMLTLGDPAPEVRLRLIHLNLERGNPAKALDVALQGQKSPTFLLEAAKIFMNQKAYAQASAVLDQLDAQAQTRPEILFYRAAIAFEGENDPEKALGFMTQVPDASPLAERGLTFRIHLLHLLGRKAEALDLAAAAKARFPHSREILLAEVGVYEEEREFDSALARLDQILAQWPGDIEILYRKGVLLDKKGDRAGAMEVMEGIIATDGTIQQLRVVSGHPLLVQSALDAVRQWRYKATRLNGEPVEVIAPIDVHFILSN